MNLSEIVNRNPKPIPWQEGEKIPWHEPEFSERMLLEHLNQSHDAASRKKEIIDQSVDWIHNVILSGKQSKILDLGCGPGFYSLGLASLGHSCTGIDFSPASIRYACNSAREKNRDCVFRLEDIRNAEFGTGLDLVMLIYGEFNVFRKKEAERIVAKAARSLKKGGKLLLEPNPITTFGGEEYTRTWSTFNRSVFLDKPHVVLTETFWYPESKAKTERYYVIDVSTNQVTQMAQGIQAYTNEEYESLLIDVGLTGVRFYPSLAGDEEPVQKALFVIVGEK